MASKVSRPNVEPARQQPPQVVVERRQPVVLAEVAEQVGAQLDQEPETVGQGV